MLPTDSPARPDVLLALVAASLLAAGVVTLAWGLPFRVTAPAGSALGGVAIADGLFRNPPTAD